MEKKKRHIEDFLLNDELNRIAKTNNREKLKTFIDQYPEDEDTISDAFLLLGRLKVSPVSVPTEQIDHDYELLFKEIDRRKRIKRSLWISIGSAAACISLIVALSLFHPSPNAATNHTIEMLSLLENLSVDTDEIQIVSGSTHTPIENNETITQTEEGNLMVREEEKLKSAELEDEYIQLVVPNGKRTTIKFHDGTIAWLNSGSKLVYPKAFASHKREIYIEGEIYIEVEKYKEKPFIVHAALFDIEVLGTKFNVSAYGEDAENSVVLVQGAVAVKLPNGKQHLLPNQGYFLEKGETQVKAVNPYIYTCWKDGIMIFDGDSLEKIFVRLARHYNVTIGLEDFILSKETYKGKLNLHASIEEVLDNLSASLAFSFEKKSEKEIAIYKKKE